MIRCCSLVLPLLVALASPLSAQPLYLGQQEIDTADRDALEAVARHCADLASRPTGTDASSDASSEPAYLDHYSKPVAVDTLMSLGDDAEAAGEGTGTGMPASEVEEEASQDTLPSLPDITLEMCKEAGVLY